MSELTNMNTNMSMLHTTEDGVKFEKLNQRNNTRLITARFRAPSRMAAVFIPNDAWETMHAQTGAAPAYRPLLDAVLETAAKSILVKRLGDMTIWPREIDTAIFSADAILAEATGANTEWMSKEELSAAWEASATRAALITNPRYASDKAYRAAVAMFADLIIKMSGKTSQYTEPELDKIAVKLADADHDTEFGTFIFRRIEQIRNKPQKAAIDLDCL